jgi:fatty-acyl-CoA synthase
VTIDARRSQLREAFPAWTPQTLDEWLDGCARTWPDRPFVITDEVTWTYAEVAQRSRELADGLAALGVRRGDRVGLLMANFADFVPLKFAIARAGAIAIPFNFLYRTEELAYVLEQSGCQVLVTMTGFMGLDHLSMLDEIQPGWEAPSPDRTLREVFTLSTDGRSRPGARTVEDLRALGLANRGASADAGHQALDVGDMLYTSGSTGSPKGVVVTHDAVLRTAYASALTRAYEDGRRILFSLPCYHMFGYVEGILSAMYVGGAVVLLPSFSAEAYLRGIERHRATDILCVPTMAVALVECEQRSGYDLSTLNAVLCGSAPAPVWLWEQVRKDFGVSEIVTGYGMTECGGAMTLTLPEDPLELTSTTVGRPKMAGAAAVAGTADLVVYRTADPATGELLPPGEVGELVSQGPTTMLGYHGKPDETFAALRGEWLYSGDLGLVRPDGYLVLTGRSKEVYKSGGELVMPKEVEEVLGAHPGVSQVYAIGLVDERWGEIGCAVVVRTPGVALEEAELIAWSKERLARFKVPRRVLFVEPHDLPTTPTGKVQKFKLVEMAGALAEGRPS